MTRTSRRDYANAVRQRYAHASRAAKAHILDEFCATTRYHRKYAIALLTAPSRPQPRGRRRTPTYRSPTVSALAAIWEAAGYPWSARPKALLPIHTGWSESRAVMGKSQTVVRPALEELRQALPFALRGVDSDNGSEFINDHLYRYCDARAIQFTRGRPYKNDDNAHIEQRNWTHVRKLQGWAVRLHRGTGCDQ